MRRTRMEQTRRTRKTRRKKKKRREKMWKERRKRRQKYCVVSNPILLTKLSLLQNLFPSE
jgi:hypothetical protein